jgi:hypothetical protein
MSVMEIETRKPVMAPIGRKSSFRDSLRFVKKRTRSVKCLTSNERCDILIRPFRFWAA